MEDDLHQQHVRELLKRNVPKLTKNNTTVPHNPSTLLHTFAAHVRLTKRASQFHPGSSSKRIKVLDFRRYYLS
ncbi:hypothetical protein RclHR1_07060009 [Rhizophagus clarus]|uniref:Uncharacterized protein n=1 Tax=Rhizophagus clarus TaxID=94130 RepID=A0A2Z6RUU9_9GLOM|nr:hypothetical protein RclHR1_07060004 [Rhizophagus clarus]GBC06816.1 hypothetical protein RclHR1_07060009 [Rhizophagus clarus]GES87829.1 hypothetical protein RCL_jg11279.t1 [Rhizophagus clarus]